MPGSVDEPLTGFGERLQVLRKTRDLTQAVSAKELALSPRYYENLEGGRKTPSLGLVLRICRRWGCSADWLLGLK